MYSPNYHDYIFSKEEANNEEATADCVTSTPKPGNKECHGKCLNSAFDLFINFLIFLEL